MDFIADAVIPALVWLMMLVVGLELTPADFRRVFRYPRAVALATLGQLLLLPAVAGVLVWVLAPEPWVTAGLILLAASPGGAISNLYTHLARGHLALSVTLTALSTLFALVTMPALIAAGFALFLDESRAVPVPVGRMMGQLGLMLLLPLGLGMTLRAWRPADVTAARMPLRWLSLVALGGLVALILVDQRDGLSTVLGPAFAVAVPYCVLTMAMGWAVGALGALEPRDRLTLMIEFGTRNLALVVIVGVMLLGQVRLVLFATLFFLTELPVILLITAIRNRAGRRSSQVSI
jgi:bile acid:Na+ symporter, BASS family